MGAAVPGIATGGTPDPMQRTAFRTSWSQPEGVVGAIIIEGVVADLNLSIWTVDVVSKYDQKFYPNVQVSSPYMHPFSGEGIYIMPDIGAKCHVCIPSDGPPPFLMDFIMPQETITNVGTEEEDSGGGAAEQPSDATFSGGRPKPKPGDIYIKGRDGNFVILHKGGVLQIGSANLAQRLYIPLQNLITDISQNYRHYNTGGSINWFLAQGESKDNPHTILKETYRLRAADKEASIRIATGEVRDPVRESDADVRSRMAGENMATKENPIYCEVTLAPEGFEADSGATREDTPDKTVLRYFFDKAGNVLLRTEGSAFMFARYNITLEAKQIMELVSNRLVVRTTGGTILSEDYLNITTKNLQINAGNKPVAHVGSVVEVFTPTTPFVTAAPIPVPSTPPTAIPPGTPIQVVPARLTGTITTGKTNILV